MAGPRWFLILLGLIVCFAVVFAAALVVVLMFVLKRRPAIAPAGQLHGIIEDWAAEKGYQLLEVNDLASSDHPFADRFGFGLNKRPAVVKEIAVRDRKGRTRRGWVYVRARLGGGGYSGFQPGSLEVAWRRQPQ